MTKSDTNRSSGSKRRGWPDAGYLPLVIYALLLCPVILSLAGCASLDSIRDEIEDRVDPPTGLPDPVEMTHVIGIDKGNLSVSGMRVLDNEDLIVFGYDRKTRTDTYAYRIPKSGSPFVQTKTGAETWNAVVDDLPNDNRIGDWSYVAAEHKNGTVRRINVKTGEMQDTGWRQPSEYCAATTDGYACYIPRGSGHQNALWNVHERKDTGVRFPSLGGIVTGLIRWRDSWVACVPDGGIQRDDKAFINAPCSVLATAGDRAVALLTSGDVYELDDFKLGKRIGSTGFKPTDYATDGRLVYWTTQRKNQLWVTNGDDMRMLADFGGTAKMPDSYGSLFWTTCGLDQGSVYVVVTRDNGGFDVWKGVL